MTLQTKMAWWWPTAVNGLLFARHYGLLSPERAYRLAEGLAVSALRIRVNGGPWGKFAVTDE